MLMGRVNLILLMTVTLMLLYGIAGAYQPSVQASVPALVSTEYFMEANSVINIIGSFSALLGPVLGGMLYSAYGLGPVLWVCMVCFLLSAVMEIFIRIPFVRQEQGVGIWKTVKGDFSESIRYIWKEKPEIGKGLTAVCGINLFLSAMIVVGLPYIVTEVLPLEAAVANKLYGFAQGALAAGGLAGGIGAGVLQKADHTKSGDLIIASAGCVFPMGIALLLFSSGIVNYLAITVLLFWHNGMFHGFYGANYVFCADGNPSKPDWESYRCYDGCFHVRTAVRQCPLWHFV